MSKSSILPTQALTLKNCFNWVNKIIIKVIKGTVTNPTFSGGFSSALEELIMTLSSNSFLFEFYYHIHVATKIH